MSEIKVSINDRVEWLSKRINLEEHQKDYITFQMKEAVKEALKQVKNNDLLHSVSESSLKTAIKHIEGSYCEAHLNTPYMLLGDVTDLIKILTGKEIDWQEFIKHSR